MGMIGTSVFIIIIFSSYIYIIYSFYKGLKKATPFNSNQDCVYSHLSCIIPFRNEQDNLPQVISSLACQNLNSDYYEVILIDDFSTDNSYTKALQLVKKYHNFRLIKNQLPGKKNAIKLGVENALNPFIVTTDADCIHPSKWLHTISKYISIHQPDLIIAPIVLSPVKSFFDHFQHLDFLSLVASGAGACEVSKPIMCNGANLIYSKELYQNGMAKVLNQYSSGDDIFLLQYAKSIKAKITFLLNHNAIVKTKPVKTLKDFIQQRVRWASKSKGYSDNYTLYVAWNVFFINVLSTIYPLTYFMGSSFFYFFSIAIFSKVFIDFRLLRLGSNLFKTPFNVRAFFLVQIIYPFYIAFIVFYAFIGSVQWKDRNIVTKNS